MVVSLTNLINSDINIYFFALLLLATCFCLLPVRDVWPRCSLSDVFGGDYWGTLQTQDDEIFFSLVWENCMVEILSTTTLGRDPIHERTKKNRWLKIVTYEYEEVEGSHPSSSSTAPRSQKSSRFEDFFIFISKGFKTWTCANKVLARE